MGFDLGMFKSDDLKIKYAVSNIYGAHLREH
jgi:hypothetical protein